MVSPREIELKEWIKRKFGFPTLRVELTEDQLDDSLHDAKLWFAMWKGQTKEMLLPIMAGINEYILPNEVNDIENFSPGISPIDLRVLFSSFNFLDEHIPYDLFRVPQAGGVYSTFAQTVGYVEMVKRIMSSEQDYEFNRDTHKLMIYPVPRAGFNVLLTYKSSSVDFSAMDPRDEDLFRRRSAAEAKERLGQIRSRFKEYPLAGGQGAMNGPELLEQAEKEKEKLQEEIIGLGGPLGIITG